MEEPRAFTLGTAGGLQLQVSNLGARWLSCRVPLPGRPQREVLLGHDSLAAHAREGGYLGAVVGRYANRLARAQFTLDGRPHLLTPNEGPHQLHGGPEGFDRRLWHVAEHDACSLLLQLRSATGDQGFPGTLDAQVRYSVDIAACSVTIAFAASVTQACPVSLASHAYFNLDGDAVSVLDHRLQLAADQVLPVDAELLPTGRQLAVADTPFDFRQPRRLAEGLGQGEQQALAGGYDHCFVLGEAAVLGRAPAAQLWSSDGSLQMEMWTSYPGLQVYSGNHLAGVKGRDGRPFAPHAGLALEPQFFPDAPNHPVWRLQGCILRPGERLERSMRVQFTAS